MSRYVHMCSSSEWSFGIPAFGYLSQPPDHPLKDFSRSKLMGSISLYNPRLKYRTFSKVWYSYKYELLVVESTFINGVLPVVNRKYLKWL
jgi:hypothetical protein